MARILPLIVVVAGPVILVATVAVLEAGRLARRAQRIRELEYEGLEGSGAYDAIPEFAAQAGVLALPDGTEVPAWPLLLEELRALRVSGTSHRTGSDPRRAS